MAQQQDRGEELTEQLASIQRDAGNFAGRLSFTEQLERTNIAERQLGEATENLARLRGRGYRWRPDLEEKLGEARGLLPKVRKSLKEETETAAHNLRNRVDALTKEARNLAHRGNPLKNEAAIRGLDGERDGLDQAIDQAERRLKALVDPLTAPLDSAKAALKDLHWTLDRFEHASFKLQPEESPVAAAQATWEDATVGEAVTGHLFFTDHRLRFEQDEEVVTKKTFFFFAAEKQQVRKLWIDEAIGHLSASDDSTRGWVMKDQLLTFSWAKGVNCPAKTTFKVQGSAKEWDDIVELLRSGDLERHRYKGELPKTDAVGVPVSWPEKCIACGAGMTPPVKGQGTLSCPYCGQHHDVVLST